MLHQVAQIHHYQCLRVRAYRSTFSTSSTQPVACDVPQVCAQYFFDDHIKQGHASAHELYCAAQHAGRVLPRLYLMVTCACCAMRASPEDASAYLQDLLEFCRGIQNPMRGLFLRSYLNTSVRSLLPDSSGMCHPSLPMCGGVSLQSSHTFAGRH